MNVLNIYPADRIPEELFSRDNVEIDNALEDYLQHLIKAHKRHHGQDITRKQALDKVDEASSRMGLTPVEGRGLFSNLWSSIKNGAANLGRNALNSFANDPVGTLQKIGDTLKPVYQAVKPVLEGLAPLAAGAVV